MLVVAARLAVAVMQEVATMLVATTRLVIEREAAIGLVQAAVI